MTALCPSCGGPLPAFPSLWVTLLTGVRAHRADTRDRPHQHPTGDDDMTAWAWSTTATPTGLWTTTCRRCGESHTTPNHSLLDAWRDRHECPEGGDTA